MQTSCDTEASGGEATNVSAANGLLGSWGITRCGQMTIKGGNGCQATVAT